jgi:hypothetical protein
MAPTTVLKAPKAWKSLAVLGFASLGLASLSAQPASALSSYGFDNTADQTLPAGGITSTNSGRHMFSDQRRYMRTFKMGSLDAYLKDITMGLFTNTANSSILFNIYEVDTATPFAPTSGSLAFGSATVVPNTGNANGTWFTPTLASSLTNFLFKAGKTYGISFNTTGTGTGGPIGVASCLGASLATCPNNTFTGTGGITVPITAGGATLALSTNTGASWTAAPSDIQTAYMEVNFTPVPAPALMGFSSLSGLMVYSRRLRSRIKGSVA